jgi:hypothetical protein
LPLKSDLPLFSTGAAELTLILLLLFSVNENSKAGPPTLQIEITLNEIYKKKETINGGEDSGGSAAARKEQFIVKLMKHPFVPSTDKV